MAEAGKRILEGVAEVVGIVTGAQPAARIHINGFAYVPEQRWEPIETAPKDGSLLLLALFPHPGFIDCPRKVGGWWGGQWDIFGGSWEPTHWMPLPPPPSPVSGNGG